jgi:hypothetical protein
MVIPGGGTPSRSIPDERPAIGFVIIDESSSEDVAGRRAAE